MVRIIFISLILATCVLNSRAQRDAKKEALEEMKKLVQLYRSSEGLTFDIAYKYALESMPGQTIDSLDGQCKLLGDRYWYRLDQTESIRTGDYVIMLFREDDIMYLARPSANALPVNPVAMIDSLLLRQEHVTCQVAEEKQWRSIALSFGVQSPYKRVEYRIDKQTGFLQKMITTVRANELEQSDAEQSNDQVSYRIIEAAFSNYRRGSFDISLLEPGRYFKKEGKEYVSVAPFENFKIFLGSPGL